MVAVMMLYAMKMLVKMLAKKQRALAGWGTTRR